MSDASSTAFEIITEFEGCRLSPYLCPANVWTMGYGSTTLMNGSAVNANTPACTQIEADKLLLRTIKQIEGKLTDLVTVTLSINQKAAIVSLIYNIGETAFHNSTLRRLLNEGKESEAADQFLLWVHAGGRVLRGLTRRREAERKLFLSP